MEPRSKSLRSRSAMPAASCTIAALVLAFAAVAGAPQGALAHHSPGHGSGPGGEPTEPPPPPPPTTLDGGTIYYHEAPGTWTIHSIQPDGSDDVTITGISGEGGTKPSKRLHHGERWYLSLRDAGTSGYFPGGPASGTLFELDLIRESDQSRVQLTDFAGACIQLWGSGPGVRYDWAPNASGQLDGVVSWIGTRWADNDNDGDCDQVIDGGIFRGAITINADGGVTFDQPTAPVVEVTLSGSTTRAAEFAWAPGGGQVAYKDASGEDLWVANVGGTRSMVFNGRVFSQNAIAWSPDMDPATSGDQTKIAFAGALSKKNGADSEWGTYTINTDGTGRTRIVLGAINSLSQRRLYWSPAGNQVVYSSLTSGTPTVHRLRRVDSGGGNDVVLVNETTGPFGSGWSVD